jgi:hypothetical protein
MKNLKGKIWSRLTEQLFNHKVFWILYEQLYRDVGDTNLLFLNLGPKIKESIYKKKSTQKDLQIL